MADILHNGLSTANSTPWLLVAPLVLALGLFVWRNRWRKMRLVTIIDGDTFMAVDRKGVQRKLRLRHVDCPETDQPGGPEAKYFVQNLAKKAWVRVRLAGKDKYRRHLADVKIGRQNLATELARQGLGYSLKNAPASVRLAGLGSRLNHRGVHRGFGQKKPWEARSRTRGRFSRWVRRKLKTKSTHRTP